MKRDDAGEFCILYVEPTDDRATLFNAIGEQKKPVVLMMAEQAQVLQRPEDFSALKHVKRQLDIPVAFVIPRSERLTMLAGRNGFTVYSSMDAVANALAAGQLVRQRPFNRTTTGTHSVPVASEPKKGRTSILSLRVVLIVLACLTLAGAGLGSFLAIFYKPVDLGATPIRVGRIYFLSSEQLSENSNQGLNDQVQVDLSNLPPPAPHDNYYAWLLQDKKQSDNGAVFLGVLPLDRGSAHLFYPGDAQHTNLLAQYSRFLVTEEDAAIQPFTPSPDYGKWRFYGAFAQTPISSSDPYHYSFLDHLRHLLAADPTLEELELPGGLNNWFYRNVGKIIEWTTSTREHWEETSDVAFVRRQAIRTLVYLDGLSYVEKDLPPATPLGVNERLARVGLLDVAGPNQGPPSYLVHIAHHLNGLIQASDSNATLRQQSASIIEALNNVRYWLNKVREDALQLARMSDQQLHQPTTLSLLNDMIDNANHAYVGQIDPTTGTMQQGVIWVHDHIQALATLDIFTFKANGSSIQLIPDMKHPKVLLAQRS
ncbi:MAG: hypothetical protein JO202_01505 [Ktedonobacteraceae bacterium]|nr:hypothetical protein [Ktedonobacteraceae bacterium]